MNRIILIGNGFDLAHGMKTSYQNFLDDYWEKEAISIVSTRFGAYFENDEFILKKCPAHYLKNYTYEELCNALIRLDDSSVDFKNKFLEIITEKKTINNWVDVENEYYILLKKLFNKERSLKDNYDIIKLNEDFEVIKKKLRLYLQNIENEFNDTDISKIKGIIGNKIYHPFRLKDFSESSLNQKAEEEYNLIKKDIEALEEGNISLDDDLNEYKIKIIKKIDIQNPLSSIKKLLQSDLALNYFDLIPEETMFLNFNYTFTEKSYQNSREFDQFNNGKFTSVKSVHIHGTTNTVDNNDIIFGFGDELDDDYKLIEKLNDNSYLENIKSINYLETDNYRKLLEFVNSGNFQIFIFGHSCGVSDRTMLNTVFEHDNCASIKLFYHRRGEGDDNYSDIVRNISRNFNDKAKMRDRVVNKNYCEPLLP